MLRGRGLEKHILGQLDLCFWFLTGPGATALRCVGARTSLCVCFAFFFAEPACVRNRPETRKVHTHLDVWHRHKGAQNVGIGLN